jgi:hypothetical protein
MSETDEHPLLRGSRQVLILGTAVMAVAAVAVLVVGTQDVRLLRLGVVAALWAALLAAFATARVRREASLWAEHADQLRTVYQSELACEVAARREHALSVEHELREQAQRREIVELRTELAAVRANLEQLLARNPQGGQPPLRAESAQLRFGPSRPQPSPWVSPALPTGTGISHGEASPGPAHGQSRHGAPRREWSVSNEAPSTVAQAQRTVSDLLATHGASTPTISGEGVFRHSLGGVAR